MRRALAAADPGAARKLAGRATGRQLEREIASPLRPEAPASLRPAFLVRNLPSRLFQPDRVQHR